LTHTRSLLTHLKTRQRHASEEAVSLTHQRQPGVQAVWLISGSVLLQRVSVVAAGQCCCSGSVLLQRVSVVAALVSVVAAGQCCCSFGQCCCSFLKIRWPIEPNEQQHSKQPDFTENQSHGLWSFRSTTILVHAAPRPPLHTINFFAAFRDLLRVPGGIAEVKLDSARESPDTMCARTSMHEHKRSRAPFASATGEQQRAEDLHKSKTQLGHERAASEKS